MRHSKYLIIGSSHAALEGAAAIRLTDSEGELTLLTRATRLPYSPTILPYVVSGRSQPDQVALRQEAYFHDNRIALERGASVVAVDPGGSTVHLADGGVWHYERLLIATGAAPALPPIPGLQEARFHVLRSMDDAVALRRAMGQVKSSVVLGGGLIGMHAAENIARAGLAVSVIEIAPRVLPGYFTACASAMIETVFAGHGVRMLTGRSAAGVEPRGDGATVIMDDGERIAADLLLVCTGVRPNIDFLAGSGIVTETGILVDDRMRSSEPNVWAAGDVAQARGFWGGSVVNGILPNAVEQGRIAGLDMADDSGIPPFAGAVPLNTYGFFGRHAISVGRAAQPDDGLEIDETIDPHSDAYRRIAMQDGRLVGIATINDFVDAGIMWQLIRRRVDLAPVRAAFIANPQATGRQLMSRIWR